MTSNFEPLWLHGLVLESLLTSHNVPDKQWKVHTRLSFHKYFSICNKANYFYFLRVLWQNGNIQNAAIFLVTLPSRAIMRGKKNQEQSNGFEKSWKSL